AVVRPGGENRVGAARGGEPEDGQDRVAEDVPRAEDEAQAEQRLGGAVDRAVEVVAARRWRLAGAGGAEQIAEPLPRALLEGGAVRGRRGGELVRHGAESSARRGRAGWCSCLVTRRGRPSAPPGS